MKKFILLTVFVTLFIVVGGAIFFPKDSSDSKNNSSPNTYQYFWSKTCPHCAKVAEFMDGWEGRDKIQMEKFEVNESRENANLFLEKGTKTCNISRNQLGVPLLITPEGKCFAGDEPIIEHLENLEL